MTIHEMKLRGNPYDLIRDGSKTVEVRLFDEKRAALAEGDLILFKKLPYLAEMLYKKVGAVKRYDTASELFAAHGAVAVGCKEDDTADAFDEGMHKYYSDEEITKYGWCAIELLPFDASTLNITMTHARRINSRDIEIYFDGDFEFGGAPKLDEFSVTLNGDPLELETGYGRRGAIHFCRMTTLRLRQRLPEGDDSPVLTVIYGGKEVSVPFEDYYKYKLITKSGVLVKGSDKLLWGEKTVARAGELVDIQLSASPDIAAQMVASGASLSIYGPGENAYHVPEHRSGYHVDSLYVEGFGGIACSITECNIWHWHAKNDARPDKNYTTHYLNENILIHEFGHGVKIAGIDRMQDRSLYTEFQMLYRHAKSAGLWPNTYAISNSDEYFATLSAIWFNVMNECHGDDGWDGTRGPINTRRELYNYDIDAYKFFSKIYPYRNLDGEWTPVPDYHKVTGLKDDPEEDFTGRNYTLNYPAVEQTDGGLKLGETYKISIPRGGMIINTKASDGHVGLWYDYSGNGLDESYISFIFEEAAPVIEQKNEIEDEFERIYTVYIKDSLGNYFFVDGNRISTCTKKDNASVFTVSVMGTHPFAMIKAGNERLVIDANPGEHPEMGTPLTLTSDEKRRGGMWRLGNFADLRRHAVFIHDGCVNGNPRGDVVTEGDTVTLSAPETNAGGKRFIGWRLSNGELADANASTTTFTMPKSDTVAWAQYE